jgi:glycine oxidase
VKRAADVLVAGGGIVGLSVALAAARRGMSVEIISEARVGQASPAAAGMLAPAVERSTGAAHDFAIAARDSYSAFLEMLADETGIRVPINRLGVLQLAVTERGVRGLRKDPPPGSSWLDRDELARLEPTLAHGLGAVFNPDDGAVDNIVLMSALEAFCAATPLIHRTAGTVTKVWTTEAGATAELSSGDRLSGGDIVLAPGAWAGSIEGAPLLKAVTPCRGQLISYQSIGLRHVTYGPRGYLVPRINGLTVAGSTMENTGFDATTTPEGLAKVRSAAEEIAPGLAVSRITSEWAGLRPITPDMLPLIGRDPEHPSIVYAAGHSRNGILLGPLTGETVATILAGDTPQHDLSQFRPGRF